MSCKGAPAPASGTDNRVCDRYDPATFGPVCAFTEWDPLEEVIVGRGDNACEPDVNVDPVWKYLFHSEDKDLGRRGPYPKSLIDAGKGELDNLARVLQNEGVTVRRPEPVDFHEPFNSPGSFKVPNGFNCTCPRDILMTVGNTILEAPMGLRTRFFEYQAYRPLVQEYFKGGANWVTAPKGVMRDSLYDETYPESSTSVGRRDAVAKHRFLTTEAEPTFDAADCMRMGKDLFFQRSLISNEFGIEWFRRTFAPQGYRIHTVHSEDPVAKHIDCTIVPVRPGIIIENIHRKVEERNIFTENGWRLLKSATPTPPDDPWTKSVIRPTSPWIGMNILSIDDRRVVASSYEKPTIDMLESLGCKVIQVPFKAMCYLGGAFHCATTDVRRRGDRMSYFPVVDEEEAACADASKYTNYVGHHDLNQYNDPIFVDKTD